MRYIKSDLHNHLRTSSHITPETVDRSIYNATLRLKKGGILGVINFNPSDTEIDPRWGLFKKYACISYDTISTGNGFFIPEIDLLVVRGQEVPASEGYHILLIGTQEDQNIANNSSLEKILTEGKAFGALIIADHPFSKSGIGLYLQQNPKQYQRFDGYEVFNRTASLPIPKYRKANKKAQLEFPTAQKYNPAIFAFRSSDGHSHAETGLVNTLTEMPDDYQIYKDKPDKLVKDIKEGYTAATFLNLESKAVPGYWGAINHIFIDLPILIGAKKLFGWDPNNKTAPFLERFHITI